MEVRKTSDTVLRTYSIWIKPGHRIFTYCEQICAGAKNLYNTTNFYIRQVYTGLMALKQGKPLHPLQNEVLDTIAKYIEPVNAAQRAAYEKRRQQHPEKETKLVNFDLPTCDRPYLTYNFLNAMFKAMDQPDYRSVPAHCAQGVMKEVFQNWKSFFAALRSYNQAPERFRARPHIPNYCRAKHKEALLSNQECHIKEGKLKLPKTSVELNIGKLGYKSGRLKQVRILPRYGRYLVEIVIEEPQKEAEPLSAQRLMSIDIGLNNLATLVTNTGYRPVLVKGGRVKSINQYYNKLRAHYVSILRHGKKPNQGPYTSNRLRKLDRLRYLKIKDLFHKTSRHIVDLAVKEQIGTIVIGYNEQWKQEINTGKRNNQSFCHIPYQMLIDMITYKAEACGIKVITVEESYTSKASYLDNDSIPIYGQEEQTPVFSGKRICRGLYRSKNSVLINADVNGAANIMRKAVSKVITDEIEGLGGNQTVNVSTPLVLSVR